MAVDRRGRDSRRAAAAVFGLYVLTALPVIVFVLADHRWFIRDEWTFLAGREVSVDGLFSPHFLQHLTAVPILVFRGMWSVFGANSYVPYQLLIAGMHLAVVVLLRVLLRHIGVGPWLATAGASILVLFGPGQDNLTWAFQITLVGPLLFGIAQLLLADHQGPLGRRDAAALVMGLLGVLSSALGVTMAIVVGLALLVRHGWRSAVLQTAPLAAVELVWAATMHPVAPEGPPDNATTLRWLRWSFTAAFEGLGHFAVVGVVLAALMVGGLALALSGPRPNAATARLERLRERVRPVAVPLAMLAGALLFAVLTARGRWFLGESGARSSRYVYVMAVLMLPALCIGAEEVARRWTRARPGLVLLLLLPIPFNVDGFDEPVFNSQYFGYTKDAITGVVDVPLARQVPRGNYPPSWHPTMGRDMTIGFLLDAHEEGRLPGYDGPLPPRLEDELSIQLVIQQDTWLGPAPDCDPIAERLELDPAVGDTYWIGSPVRVSLAQSATDPPTWLRLDPANGAELVFKVAGVPVVLARPIRAETFLLCEATQ